MPDRLYWANPTEGGGARGLSSLTILAELMRRLQNRLGMEDAPSLRDHFDIVAGTGTGAVIACMVGRLGIPIDEAIIRYLRLADVFSERKRIGSTAYKTTKLQSVLKSILKDDTGSENIRMMDTSEIGEVCRTMVFAMSKHNMNAGTPRIFRSYQIAENQMPDCAIWEAASASMAHPELFKSIDIGDIHAQESFVDGGLRCTNPTAYVLAEAKTLFPDRYLSALVCIGAGHPRTIEISETRWFASLIPRNVLAVTKQIAEDAEQVAQEIARRFRSIPGAYFRFSVDQGLQSIGSNEWEKLNRMTAHTRAYTQRTEVNMAINQATEVIRGRKGVVDMSQLDGELRVQSAYLTTSARLFPSPTPIFTGREDILKRIIKCISQNDRQRSVCVLCGLGGAGKTQLALKTVERTEDIWTDVVFVDAMSHEAATTTLVAFARKKQVGESAEIVVQWLAKQHGGWLMVIDNADDPSVDIRRYIPAGNTGSILITTRIEQHALLSQGDDSYHQVSGMNEEEAMKLLLKTAKIDDHGVSDTDRLAAVQLLESLGYLALAVVQAGAYIFASKRSIAQYYRMFSLHQMETLEAYNRLPVKADDYQKSVYTTWHMSYILLGASVQRLLHLIAFMHHTGIMEETFRRAAINLKAYDAVIPATEADSEIRTHVEDCLSPYLDSAGAWDSLAFVESMRELLSYSLISYDSVSDAYTLHVLVHDWASTVVAHPTNIAVGHTSLLLAASINYDDSTESLAYKRMIGVHVSRVLGRQERPNANDAPRFAEVYYRAGNSRQVEKLERVTLDGRLRALGPEHGATLTSINNLANAYREQGNYQEAAALLEQVVEVSKRVSGHESRETLIPMRNLAQTYWRLGRYHDAELLQLHVLDTTIRVHGDDHPDTLWSMQDLALTYNEQGRYNEAEPLLVKVVDARKRISGHEHPRTLSSMHTLAYIYYDQQRYKEAELIQEQVLAANKRSQGDEHPDTLSTMNELALTYHAQNRYEDAEALQVRVMEAKKRVYGEDHPSTLTTMNNLALTYRSQGRYEQAEELGKQVMEGDRRTLGESHPHALLSMRNLRVTYKAMGESRQQEYEALDRHIQEIESGKKMVVVVTEFLPIKQYMPFFEQQAEERYYGIMDV